MKQFIDKLIERLEQSSHWENPTFDEDGYCNDDSWEVVYLDKAIEIINQLAEEYNNGWIPCSERLPEAYKNVLVCEENGEIHLCRYNTNMKRFFYDGSDWDIKLSEVIAWQPLPAPYQMKGE